MTKQPYNQPPITEAVIEIRFAKISDHLNFRKVIKKLKNNYEALQELNNQDIKVEFSNLVKDEPTVKRSSHITYRFSSSNMTQLLLLTESSFTVSQLAPYNGWDEFLARFIRDWKVWRKIVGFSEIKRIGVRYINRLDIPISGPILKLSDFVNIFPEMPKILGTNLSYAVQANFPIVDLKSILTISSATMPSPLTGFTSIVIDQDISKEADLPKNEDSIISFLNEVRDKKNEIFESCITDKARKLFNNG